MPYLVGYGVRVAARRWALIAQAVQIGVAILLLMTTLYAAACARKAMGEARAGREDTRRLHGALEVLALLLIQRTEAPTAAAPVDVDPVESVATSSTDGDHEEREKPGDS
jgi:hypothetical protein